MRSPFRYSIAILVLLVSDAARGAGPDLDFFEKKVRPVLVAKCYECHSGKSKILKGGLRLDSRAALLRGGDSGPAIVPGKPDESLLLQAMQYSGLEMPPSGRLPKEVVADFERWIARGAVDPRSESPETSPADIARADKSFWCFQPLAQSDPPSVKPAEWPLRPIDAYVRAALDARRIEPISDADRRALLRRTSFDLIGLPPTPADLDTFAADESIGAYEKVVDRLLASPHFGERWGRHWLDVARFAESSGGGRSMLFPEAWRYRDYVIAAFNADLPFDRFIAEQLSGDLLAARDAAEKDRLLIATGFLVLGPHNYEEQDKTALDMDIVDEQLDTLGRAFLGMTIGCARCHDHKFDPIPTRDYYALAGILRSTEWYVHENVSRWIEPVLPTALESKPVAAAAAMSDRLNKLVRMPHELDKTGNPVPTREEKRLRAELARLTTQVSVPQAMAIEEARAPVDCAIRIRGNPRTLGAKVPRGVLSALAAAPTISMPANQSGRRELAVWLAVERNPLAARVIVNRVWLHLIGRGIVATTDNFGATGERPSHPELLDALANDFVRHNGSIKRLVRSIVTSRTYRLAFGSNPAAEKVDAENRLLWRANRKRIDAESLRDAMLAAGGSLERRMSGPTIGGLKRSKTGGEPSREYEYVFSDSRRSVYTPVFRNKLPDLFEVFDFADPNHTIGDRNESTTASQSLFLLNDPFVMEQARRAARQVAAFPENSAERRVVRAFALVLGRAPTAEERRLFLEELAASGQSERAEETWERLFHGLFASVDFRCLE